MNTILKKTIFFALVLSGTFLSAKTLEEAIRFSENEQYEIAQQTFQKLIQENVINGDYYFYAGENYFKAEKTNLAVESYTKGISTAPENPINYVGLGKVKWYNNDTSAIALFSKAINLSKSKNTSVLLEISEAYIYAPKKKLNEAILLLNNAIKIDSKNTNAYLFLGDAYLAQNNASEAIKYYEKAVAISPNSPLGILKIGQLYKGARNYELALEYFQNSNTLDSNFAPAYREKGDLYFAAKKYDNAIVNFKKYLSLNNNQNSRLKLIASYYLSKQYDNTILESNEILKTNPNNTVAYRFLMYSYFDQGNHANALVNSKEFFIRASTDQTKIIASDYQYQGKIFAKNGNDSLAILAFNKALSLDSSNVEVYDDLGGSYFKIKQYSNAASAFEKKIALKSNPGANDYNLLGRALYSNKEYAKADSVFGIIIGLKPDLLTAYLWRARSNAKLDPDFKTGAAKMYYELFIEKAKTDEEKNKKDLTEAYSYLGSYYGLSKDYTNAKIYYGLVLILDPNNVQSKAYLKSVANQN